VVSGLFYAYEGTPVASITTVIVAAQTEGWIGDEAAADEVAALPGGGFARHQSGLGGRMAPRLRGWREELWQRRECG